MGLKINTPPPRISVLINTLNEENNISNAIQSVNKWAYEVIIVDMYSDDRTASIAESLGAKVYYHEKIGYVEPARKYAESKATGNWILIIDADEMIPHTLSQVLIEVTQKNDYDVLRIPRLNYFSGEPLFHTGWGPEADGQLRFYKKNYLVHSDKIHVQPECIPQARVIALPYRKDTAITHFNYINMTQFIEKLNNYTSIQANELLLAGKTVREPEALRNALNEFWQRYEKAEGYNDGWKGFYYSAFMAFYQIAIYGKLTEIQTVGQNHRIRSIYAKEAERILSEYESKTPEKINLSSKKNDSKKILDLQLHLGCGEKNIKGMLNCDYRDTEATDLVTDCTSLEEFETESTSFIFSNAFFEHLYKDQHITHLQNCNRILKSGAQMIYIGIPDFEVIARAYLNKEPGIVGPKFDLFNVYRYTHGDPERVRDWWLQQLHKSIFDKDYIYELLTTSGFGHFKIFNYCYPGEKIPLCMGFIAGNQRNENKIDSMLDTFKEYIDLNSIYMKIEFNKE